MTLSKNIEHDQKYGKEFLRGLKIMDNKSPYSLFLIPLLPASSRGLFHTTWIIVLHFPTQTKSHPFTPMLVLLAPPVVLLGFSYHGRSCMVPIQLKLFFISLNLCYGRKEIMRRGGSATVVPRVVSFHFFVCLKPEDFVECRMSAGRNIGI